MSDSLSVREISLDDIDLIADYWASSDPAFLISMGVDLAKVPPRADLVEMLWQQLSQPYNEKKSYAIIWLVNGKPVGHSNTNKIVFGEEAYMHLHLWNAAHRRMGFGSQLVKMTLPYFFNN
ncbi:MAG: GNAT family protein, partial [Bacteroidetes bacterium]|nr:GNAT family protein [Bacteroidota bacterium]